MQYEEKLLIIYMWWAHDEWVGSTSFWNRELKPTGYQLVVFRLYPYIKNLFQIYEVLADSECKYSIIE